MTNFEYYKTPNALIAARKAFCDKTLCRNCAVYSGSGNCTADFGYMQYVPENMPIPAWLFDKRTHLLGKLSSRLFDIGEVTSTPSHIVITVSCHHGSDINTHVETYPNVSDIHDIYDVITIEVVPT